MLFHKSLTARRPHTQIISMACAALYIIGIPVFFIVLVRRGVRKVRTCAWRRLSPPRCARHLTLRCATHPHAHTQVDVFYLAQSKVPSEQLAKLKEELKAKKKLKPKPVEEIKKMKYGAFCGLACADGGMLTCPNASSTERASRI